MDIFVALAPMALWGLIGLVSGKVGGDANQQTLGMTIGAFLFSVVTVLFLQPTLNSWILLVGFLPGLFWSVGQNGQFHAMKHLGVSVGQPLSTGMQLILNTVAGVVLFHEWTKSKDYILGIAALLLLLVGAYLTARQDDDGRPKTDQKMLNFSKGFRSLFFSTIGYGLYTISITWADIDPAAVILPQSAGMLVGASMLTVRKVSINRFVWKNMSSGLLWGAGNVCMLLTLQKVGLAVSFSLSQMGIIISTLGGIFLLGETKTKKEMTYVISGCLLVIIGGILLGYMKAT
ncbi:glucose transporter GlcU [Enterococcus sp. JM4C]|uniref:GRP family sugar transporter n=1 Tax=Candidatus Enterococcus huntleyi TaxID=1857217 RepID=UPI00137956DE|nr:GRP family sugar transporter [Enterococcus sp. JM4C]KAF1299210.1 glucose transporter GlcU [Enterococcus sp. JM4C]